ncbi:MAG: heme exporter protein CcmD [Gammaproteobacteria bacterium]|nr:heme exporter protein CcmD [Gammaproteobacteria bacterium]
MGGYGPYVWSCIGLTLIVLAVCAISARRRQHRIFNDIRTQLKAMEQSR